MQNRQESRAEQKMQKGNEMNIKEMQKREKSGDGNEKPVGDQMTNAERGLKVRNYMPVKKR